MGEPDRRDAGAGVWAIDTRTFEAVGRMGPERDDEHLELSSDGALLHALSPRHATLTVYDTRTFQQIGSVDQVGRSVALASAAPRRLEGPLDELRSRQADS